jgi:hypothetical protein
MAAGQACRIDPSLAAKYHRLLIDVGKHHNSALCHIATTPLTRIIACWRAPQPYVLRDVDGTPVTNDHARAIIAEPLRHTQRPPCPPPNQHRHGNRPAKQGVANRSINRPVQPQRYDPRRGLTSLRNSTRRCSPRNSATKVESRWRCSSGCAEFGSATPGPTIRRPAARWSGSTRPRRSGWPQATRRDPLDCPTERPEPVPEAGGHGVVDALLC